MKISLLKIAGFVLFIVSGVSNSYGQARSNLSFGYSINKPYSGDYEFGRGFIFQGTIAISDKLAIVPALGYDHLGIDRSKNEISGSYTRKSSIDLFYLSASVKYYFYQDFFAKAGPVLFAAGGNEDLANAGLGGAGAVGYNLNLDNHSTLEFTLNTTIIDIPPQTGNGTTAIASFKIAYAFNFRRLNR